RHHEVESVAAVQLFAELVSADQVHRLSRLLASSIRIVSTIVRMNQTSVRGRMRKARSDGERSRDAILREAAQLATVEGIDGLSIGRLADAVGMSKSGLFAHFGSKQELQLATIEAASALFNE